MSTLPFSLGSYTPRKLIVTSNLHTPEETSSSSSSSSLKFSSHFHNETTTSPPALLKLNENPVVVFKRREAIGVGLCSGILGVILQQSQVSPAEAGEASAPCELTQSPSGLAYCDKVVGYGPEAVKGQLIKAHYVGKLENGKVFDSSYNRGKPLTFRIGVGEVIKGWDQGILGGDGVPPMLAGGKRSLKLPPELGYGIRGAGCRGGSCIIPPDSVLLFDVEFIGKTHYVGKLENGKVFDSSYNRGKPLTFRVGVGEVIKGWDQGILGGDGVPPMLAGGKRSLKLPPELGYGIRGAGCRGGSCIIPPDSVLLFDVEFIGKG